MKLNLNQIKQITLGAARIDEQDGLIRFFRFTKEQEELYKTTNNDSFIKTFSTAGVKLSFKTDSKKLFLSVLTNVGTSRKYFSIDVFKNGQPIGYLDNFEGVTLPDNYTTAVLPLGSFSKEFNLGEGKKHICVHLPWSTKTAISDLCLDDNAFIKAVRPEKKLLVFGDSITHGYDALRPSNRYICKLAESLGAEEFNKAIGGERFLPPLAQLKENFVPDYITVAYGTNDWSACDRETFNKNCVGFYSALSKSYPTSKIFASTPIWRKDYNEERAFGKFEDAENDIIKAVESLKNVTVIRGFDLVPHDEKYFADFRLHPNDEGFEYYANNLYEQIKKYI